jgi:predicted cobalt transporter CbtA
VSTVTQLLGRGALAGGAGGLISGLFGLFVAEPVVDRAIRLEEAHSHDATHTEVFTRDTQHLGLIVAALVTGIAIGVIVALVYGLVYRRGDRDPWRSALWLAASGYLAVSLLPSLRYPANPPGVGDPGSIDLRTRLWLAALVIGLAVMAGAWRLAGWLAARGASEPTRHLAVAAVPVVGLALLFILPGNPDTVDAPADLLWTFRLCSLATTATLWAGLGVTFGLLGRRAAAAARSAVPAAADRTA